MDPTLASRAKLLPTRTVAPHLRLLLHVKVHVLRRANLQLFYHSLRTWLHSTFVYTCLSLLFDILRLEKYYEHHLETSNRSWQDPATHVLT